MGFRPGSGSTPRLTILHVNDTHSHLEPIRTGQYAGLGGILERTAYIDSVRKADGPENVLLLHAGDFCQGTTYFSEFGAPLMVKVLNAMHYDVATLGNHEFDNGIEALGEALSACEVPVVCCNYDFSPFEAGKYIRPYVILEKAGLKIGVIGVLCPLKEHGGRRYRQPPGKLTWFPPSRSMPTMPPPQCDLVIALTHIGYKEHNPGDLTGPHALRRHRNIDLFVGGHSHTFLERPPMHRTWTAGSHPHRPGGLDGPIWEHSTWVRNVT